VEVSHSYATIILGTNFNPTVLLPAITHQIFSLFRPR